MRRRQHLATIGGTASAPSLAGCSSSDNDGGGGTSCGPGENEIGAIDSDTSMTVTITGQVVSFDSTAATAVINDGTGQAGVRIGSTEISDPNEGDCVTVTGTPGGVSLNENTDIQILPEEASMAGNDNDTNQ